MNTTHQRVERHTTPHTTVEERHTNESVDPVEQGVTTAQKLIHFMGTLFASLLVIRFILALFGANPNNGFVSFVYGVTQPLVAPFRNMFAAETTAGTSRFEIETIVAIALVLVVTALLSRLVGLMSARREV
jgi:YggT family protein